MIIGIDFGAKKAGTTVIARMFEHNRVDLFACKKGEDADDFILNFIENNEDIWLAYIDAPLSLPKIYCDEKKGESFFYRKADQLTGAMSPMFLGGLTARAMKVAKALEKLGVKSVETYPSKLAEVLQLKEHDYKGSLNSIPLLCDKFKKISSFEFDEAEIKSWHHFDALLCLYSAKRHEMQAAMIFGNEEEGMIIV